MSEIKAEGANEGGVGTKKNPRRINEGTMAMKGRRGKMGRRRKGERAGT